MLQCTSSVTRTRNFSTPLTVASTAASSPTRSSPTGASRQTTRSFLFSMCSTTIWLSPLPQEIPVTCSRPSSLITLILAASTLYSFFSLTTNSRSVCFLNLLILIILQEKMMLLALLFAKQVVHHACVRRSQVLLAEVISIPSPIHPPGLPASS